MMTGIERRPMSPEAILADGCAPVIMGAKPSNLVSFDSSAAGFSAGWLLDSRAKFARSGIASYELRRTDARTLVLFYRPCMLSLCLGEPQSAALLRRCGYREGNLGALLAQLTERMRGEEAFPHEIGLFLGYPVRDVESFIASGGQGEALSGYWKVYDDVTAARRSFELYDRCRTAVAGMVKKGYSLSNILLHGGNHHEGFSDLLVGIG